MRNALTLLLIGAGQGALAALYPRAAWLLLWSGGSFCVVAAAYAFQKPRLLGKRLNGTMAWGVCVLLLPYLLLTWLIWYAQTGLSHENVCDEVAPGLWLGRRATVGELPRGVSLIVDLTSEFPEPRSVRENFAYLCLPTLDNAAPEQERFQEVIQKMAAWEGETYVHCALGHGRSALVAAAVLMAWGLACSPEEAFAQLKRARPGVKLNQTQRGFLKTSLDEGRRQKKRAGNPALFSWVCSETV